MRPNAALNQPDAVGRPEAQEGFAFYVLLGEWSEHPRVCGVSAIVAHHEDVVLRDGRLCEGACVGELVVGVWLLLALSIDVERAVPFGDLIFGQGDDALYEVLVGVVYAPEDYYVAALGLREAVDELVDQHPVADLEGWDHAAGRDPERLHDERPDEAE